MKDRRWIAVLALVAVVGAVEIAVWRSEPEPGPQAAGSEKTESASYLRPGDVVSGFDANNLRDGRERIDYPKEGGKTLLFVFSATCGTCKKTIPYWNRLVQQERAPVRFYGLLVGGGDGYAFQAERELVESGEIGFPVLQFMDRHAEEAYKVFKVPQTIVVGPAGVVEMCHLGVLTDQLVDEIESLLEPTGS